MKQYYAKIPISTLRTGGLIFLLYTSVATAAAPPSQKTPEEILWGKLSASIHKDLTSQSTWNLMENFMRSYSDHPRAINVRYLYSERAFKLKDYKQASVGYEKFLLLHPKNELADSAAYRVGECYFNLGAYNSALASWEKLIKNYKKSSLVPNALDSMAVIYMKTREWGRADDTLEKLIKEYPVYAKKDHIRTYCGIVKYHLGDLSEAAQTLQGIALPHAAYFRGLALFSLQLFEESVEALNTVVGSKSSSYHESAAFLKAEGFFKKKNFNLAAREFYSFIENFPKSDLAPYAEIRRATCHLLARETNNALAVSSRLLRGKIPPDVEQYAAFIKASGHMEEKKYSEAGLLFSKITQQKEFPSLASASLIRLAWCQKNLKNFPSFNATLKTLEEKYPSSPEMPLATFLTGVQLYEKEEWEDAGNRFEKTVLSYPYNKLSEAGLALMTISYTNAKRYDQLVTASNSALKILEGNFPAQDPYWRAQSYHFIGNAYYELNRFKNAIPFYEKGVRQYPDSELTPRSQLMLSWSYLETQNPAKAREYAQGLIQNNKTPKELVAQAAYLHAVSYFNSKQYDPAIVELTQYVKDHPQNAFTPKAQYLIGLSYHQKKIYGSAVEEWEKLISQYPSHPLSQEAYLYIGDLTFKAGDYEKAARTFRSFRDRWPNSKYRQTALWQELQAYFNGKIDETAIKVYSTYIESYPKADNIEDAKKQLEMIYYRRGAHGDPDKLNEFLSRFPQSPFSPSARFKLGDMAMEQKNWPRAVQEMEQFVRDYPGDTLMMDALYALGLAHENMGDTEKAVIQYRNLMDQFSYKPNAVDAAFRLGSLYFKRENYAEAVRAFEFAAKKKMSDELKASVYYNSALAYENLGQLDKAAQSYGAFAHYSKDKNQAREALMNAGLLLKKTGKYPQAASYFQKALKEGGDSKSDLEAVNLLGECYKESGKTASAIKTYHRLIGMEPVSSDLRLAGLAQLAYLYEQKKDFKKAVQIYEKISVSEGKAEWVNAAKARVEELIALLNPAP